MRAFLKITANGLAWVLPFFVLFCSVGIIIVWIVQHSEPAAPAP